jgi:hypothetical protein
MMHSAANCELSPKQGRFFVSLKLCDDAMMFDNGMLACCLPFVQKWGFEGVAYGNPPGNRSRGPIRDLSFP